MRKALNNFLLLTTPTAAVYLLCKKLITKIITVAVGNRLKVIFRTEPFALHRGCTLRYGQYFFCHQNKSKQ